MNSPEPVRPRASVAGLTIAVIALAVFAGTLSNGFAYDDIVVIVNDARVHGFDLGAIFANGYWQDAELALYRPLTTLSFALDWSLAPASAAWFHLTNALLHAATAVLVFMLLGPLFGTPAALAGGLVFAVHPVHVEAVANIVGRAELLSACFVLAACVLWQRRSERDALHGAAVAGCFLLALLAKESAAVLPALLVLLDAAKGTLRPGTLRPWLRQRGPALAALVVVFAGVVALRTAVLGGFGPSRVDPILEVAATPGARVLTALQAWPVWLRLLFVPDVLLADYGPRIMMPASSLTLPGTIGLLLAGGLFSGGMFAWLRGQGRTAMALLWFPVAILPVSNLVVPIGVLVAERTLYLPSVAFSCLVAGAAALPAWRGTLRAAGFATLAGILLMFSYRTVTRVPDWASTDSIMLALVRDRPDAFRGVWHTARMARTSGAVDAAVRRYAAAVELWPHRAGLVYEAAAFAAEQGLGAEAYRYARLAAGQWPAELRAQRLLAGAALDVGDTTTARAALAEGLRIDARDELLNRMRAALDSSTAGRP